MIIIYKNEGALTVTIKRKIFGLGATALLVLGIAACSADNGEETEETVGESVDYKITGIEPGAGIMDETNRVIDAYDLDKWTLTASSDAGMTAALKKAYDREDPIIITAWTPHWKFSEFDLKYLDDPKNINGGEEEIRTIGRLGLKEDLPEAYEILSNFHWTMEDMGDVMIAIHNGEKEEEAARNWVNANKDKVEEWTAGIEKVDGDQIKLAYVAWDSEIASHNVMRVVLEEMGYHVKLMQVELGPLFTAIANGSADATLAVWLPIAHKTYADKFKGEFEELGVNMEGVRSGLAVPEYMDIDSIEDLKE